MLAQPQIPQAPYIPLTQPQIPHSQRYELREREESSSPEADDVVSETQPSPQPTDQFWDTVKASFDLHTRSAPDYRSVHCITSKTKSLNAIVAKFAGIYNTAKNTRKSGGNDTIILQKARYRFQEENGKSFAHEHAWEILKDSEKFNRVVLVTSTRRPRASKRTNTSEFATPTKASFDAHGPLNLEDEDDAEDDDDRPRPKGRNAARRAGSTSTIGGSNESVTTLLAELNTLNSKSDTMIDVRQKELEICERDLLTRQRDAETRAKDAENRSMKV